MTADWAQIDELTFPPVRKDLLVRVAPALLDRRESGITVHSHAHLLREVMIELADLDFAADGHCRFGMLEKAVEELCGHRQLEQMYTFGGRRYRIYYSADFVKRKLVVLEAVFPVYDNSGAGKRVIPRIAWRRFVRSSNTPAFVLASGRLGAALTDSKVRDFGLVSLSVAIALLVFAWPGADKDPASSKPPIAPALDVKAASLSSRNGDELSFGFTESDLSTDDLMMHKASGPIDAISDRWLTRVDETLSIWDWDTNAQVNYAHELTATTLTYQEIHTTIDQACIFLETCVGRTLFTPRHDETLQGYAQARPEEDDRMSLGLSVVFDLPGAAEGLSAGTHVRYEFEYSLSAAEYRANTSEPLQGTKLLQPVWRVGPYLGF